MFGYLTLGFASAVTLLLIVAVVSGFGNGVLRPSLTSLITHQAGQHEQGIVLGITQSLSSLAAIASPVIAGMLIERQMLTLWAWMSAAMAAGGLLVWTTGKGEREGAVSGNGLEKKS